MSVCTNWVSQVINNDKLKWLLNNKQILIQHYMYILHWLSSLPHGSTTDKHGLTRSQHGFDPGIISDRQGLTWCHYGPPRTQHGVNTDDTGPSRIAKIATDQHGATRAFSELTQSLHGPPRTTPDWKIVPNGPGYIRQFYTVSKCRGGVPNHAGTFQTNTAALRTRTDQHGNNTDLTPDRPNLSPGDPGWSGRSVGLGLYIILIDDTPWNIPWVTGPI